MHLPHVRRRCCQHWVRAIDRLLDVGLPEEPRAGLALLGWIREQHPDLPCALLTGSCEPDVVNTAARLRARVLIKPATSELQSWVVEHVDAATASELVDAIARRAGVSYRLTERENLIVAWFLEGGDLASFLTRSGMSRSTFKSHRASILAKTGLESLERLSATLLVEALARRGRSGG